MALPFLNGQTKKRDQIIAIDLGTRSTKAVHLQRRGDSYTLLRYCIIDAPIFEKTLSVEMLTDHLKAVHATLETKSKQVSIAIGVNDSIVRPAELPPIPVDDMRQILKINSKNYLQQELPGHVFDCYFPPVKPANNNLNKGMTTAASQKLKVLVGGAKKQLIDDIQAATRGAGLVPAMFVPGIVGPYNAFEMSNPEIFARDCVALVDIGFKTTSICLLQNGELIVMRVVNIGGDKLTQGLVDAMNITYAEAEGIKVGMPTEVKSNLDPLITPLGRELRASIDFFEHQQDKTVSHIYISGGTARSEFIVKALEVELVAPCSAWNPTATLQMELPPMQVGELEKAAPQLTVAVGTAAVAF